MPTPCLALASNASRGIESDHLLDLLANAIRLGRRQIDLVDYRDDFEIVVQRKIGIGQRLRFDALRGIDHKQRAFARLQAARNFIGEINVPRRIDEIELILLRRLSPCNRAEQRAP